MDLTSLLTVKRPGIILQILFSSFNILYFISLGLVFALYICFYFLHVETHAVFYFFVNVMLTTSVLWQMFQFTNFSWNDILLFTKLFLVVMFITSFICDFMCWLQSLYITYVPLLSLQFSLWPLYKHMNNKELNLFEMDFVILYFVVLCYVTLYILYISICLHVCTNYMAILRPHGHIYNYNCKWYLQL